MRSSMAGWMAGAMVAAGCSLAAPDDDHFFGGASGGASTGGAPGDASDCPSGQKRCGDGCVSTDDPENGCAGPSCAACSLPNASATCSSGACAVGGCTDGWADCDGTAENGCEADLGQDDANCGSCKQSCASLPGVDAAHCSAGACAIDACKSGFGDCDTTVTSGCEQDLTSAKSHCGACGSSCKDPVSGTNTGAPSCAASQCSADCSTGYSLCPTTLGPACVELKKDPLYCGSCATSCPAGATCTAGGCASSGCAFGQLACAGGCANPKSNPLSCGACEAPCDVSKGEVCSFGTCVSSCGAGLGTCTVGGKTACVDLQKDPDHCGACNKPCGPGEICAAGKCNAFRFASGCWQCGLGNLFPKCCTVTAQAVCLPATATCP